MRYLVVLAILPFLMACSGKNGDDLETNFHIEGKISGAANKKVKIIGTSDRGQINVAETTTDASGNYTLDGNIPGIGIYTMVVGEDKNAILIPLSKNDDVTISGTLESFPVSPQISGTEWAKPLTSYMKLFDAFATAQINEMPKITDQAKQIERFNELRKPLDAFVQKQVNADPANPVNLIFTSLMFPTQELGYKNWDPKNLELLKKVEQAFIAKHNDSPYTGILSEQIVAIEAGYNGFLQYESGNMSAPEIALKNPDGKEMRLSDLKGKVVLVDFWASWCGPCRQENPNVVRMYKELKSKGFEVFSVSLDQDPSAWKGAIKKDGLIWPNHVSDLQGWQTPLVQAYGFNAIPYTVVVNRQGNIVGVGLRGSELEQKLKEELAK